MGEVWAATHAVTLREVALKFLKVDDGTLPVMRRRFVREARAAAAVKHPNVILVHDVFELDDQTPVMVMDLLTGEPLAERLVREGAISMAETARIMAPVVSAVGTAHEAGIVHRDLKPENIFLADAGQGEVDVKVLDFGIAKLNGGMELGQTGNITGTGAVLGTPYYMALEQAYGEKDVDHRADVWSLGVILYECLSGRRPVTGDNFGQIIKHLTNDTIPPLTQASVDGGMLPVPQDVSDMVGRMLQRRREDRPDDLRDVLAVLRRYTSASVRTFGGARRALEDSAARVDADDREEASADTQPAPRLPRADDQDPTVPVAATSVPEAISSPTPSARPSSRKPIEVHVTTARRVSPQDVTLAEGSSVNAPPAGASRRTALIAALGAGAGILITVATLMFLRVSPRSPDPGERGSASSTPPALGAGPTPPAASTQPAESATPAQPAQPAQPSVTAEPAERAEPQGTARPTAEAPELHTPGPSTKHGVATGGARPPSSARPVASSHAAAPTAEPREPPAKRTGGLVDEPPF